MKNFKNIQEKLQGFIQKYYRNEIIKGSILFFSFGLLYFILTLFVEYFLWLKPLARSILFWVFVLVEIGLIIKLIVIPILKLFGLRMGISLNEASKIIGEHFDEVDDKLLNILQLNESDTQSDLLVASIEQKSKGLQPIPFKNAINIKSNSKYIQYVAIPVIIWLMVFVTGNNSIFTSSLNRVVHHKMAFAPPAPFTFKILNKTLEVIEGKPFKLLISTNGNIIPDDVKIVFHNESYYLNHSNLGTFYYEFESLNKNLEFFLKANHIESIPYHLEVIKTPKIINFEMLLNFPAYLKRKSELVKNTGNALIPEGTEINWHITSENTDKIKFIANKESYLNMEIFENDIYNLKRVISKNMDYRITTSNRKLKNFEELSYRLEVIKDEYPRIVLKSDIDSIHRGPIQFVGQLSDDYGISKLQVIVKNLYNNTNNLFNIDVGNSDFEEFYYIFPKGIVLDEGVDYEIYFEVFDNDGIHDRKKTRSNSFYYRNKTEREIKEELLNEQKQNLDKIQNSKNTSKEIQKSLEKLSEKLKSKNNVDWNDRKQLDEFFDRIEKHNQILKDNTTKLYNNLEEMNEENNLSLEDRKEELKKRIKEVEELQKKKALLRELQELADKLKKEDLLEKVDRLKEQSKQENRSLERILELTKRFYVEKKSVQIMRKIEELSKKQENLSISDENNTKNQEDLNRKFDSIKKDFMDLENMNKELKSPMDLPDTKKDQKGIEQIMDNAKQHLKKSETEAGMEKSSTVKNARQNQKSAAKKLKELSEKMETQMTQMEMEGLEENIKDLQQILDNLIIFSFDQETLLKSFENIDSKNAEYPTKLKKQQILKVYFEHIDDSLYALSLRMVRLSSRIEKDLTDAHYNLDKSLENISENRIRAGIASQQYTMTAANNLADLLSDILDNLQNKKPGNGSGKGKEGEGVSLPDIIKKQEKLLQDFKDGMMKGDKQGNKSREQMSGDQFEIYKQQNELREELRSLLENEEGNEKSGEKLLKQMERLESMLLKKGFTKDVLENMNNLMQELLKLESASFERGNKVQRESDTNTKVYDYEYIKLINSEKLNFSHDEILIRNALPLQPVYRKKVKSYFEKRE